MLFIKTECLVKTAESKQLARENIGGKKKRKTLFNLYVKVLHRHVLALGTLGLKFCYHS